MKTTQIALLSFALLWLTDHAFATEAVADAVAVSDESAAADLEVASTDGPVASEQLQIAAFEPEVAALPAADSEENDLSQTGSPVTLEKLQDTSPTLTVATAVTPAGGIVVDDQGSQIPQAAAVASVPVASEAPPIVSETVPAQDEDVVEQSQAGDIAAYEDNTNAPIVAGVTATGDPVGNAAANEGTVEIAAVVPAAPPAPHPSSGEELPPAVEPPLPDLLSATPTGNVVVNLIQKLVERGVLTEDDSKAMIAQAQAEAETQRAQNEADMFAIAQVAAVQTMTDPAVAGQTSPSALESAREEMRVSYIPLPVRMQLKDEIRRELAAEGLGSANLDLPTGLLETLARIKPEGEIRLRMEADLYPQGNDSTGAFPNFNAINTGAPFDVTGTFFSPQWNVDQDRTRYRLLARFGLGIELGDNFSAGFRLATGDGSSPVSANQSLGAANDGEGGNFSDYAVWLDRAYLRYDLGGGEDEGAVTFWAGRFDNPFFSTPLIFDDDLGFDGVALRLSYNYRNTIIPSIVGGAFPVYNTDLNFSSNQPLKYPSYDKYLFAIQAGTQINLTRHWNTELAAAYYYFYNIEGKLSSPFVPLSPSDAGDTDNSRPSFAQKGNTYFPIRNITPSPDNNFGQSNQWQYFGLATPFENFVLTGKLNYDGFEPVRVSLVGEFVQNLAFNSSQINEIAVNNRGEVRPDNSDPENIDTFEVGPFDGDGYAWMLDLVVGHPELDRLGAWQFSFGYRWIGSDAVVDGFNDSDFGFGGSNMKGFTVAGRLALTPHVYIGTRWFGSESIAGPQFDMNIFQFDIGAKF